MKPASPFVYSKSHGVPPGARIAHIPVTVAGKTELLALLAKGLGFPDWFGHNWDALVDLLRDFSWSEENSSLAVVHDGLPANLARSDLATYLEILSDAATAARVTAPARPRLLVSFPPAARAEVERLLLR